MEELLKIKRLIEIKKILNPNLNIVVNIKDYKYKFKKATVTHIEDNYDEHYVGVWKISSDYKVTTILSSRTSENGRLLHHEHIETPQFSISIYDVYLGFYYNDIEKDMILTYQKLTGNVWKTY